MKKITFFKYFILSLFIGLALHLAPALTSQVNCVNKSMGDADCNHSVDLADYEIWRREFIREKIGLDADFNNDSQVRITDFEIWRRTFINGPETTH